VTAGDKLTTSARHVCVPCSTQRLALRRAACQPAGALSVGLVLVTLLGCASQLSADPQDPPAFPKPISHWKFDETVGTLCHDEGSWQLHGKYDSGAAPGRGVVGLAAAWRNPRRQQRITVPRTEKAQGQLSTLFSGTFSIELWLSDSAQPPDGKTNYAILYKADRENFTRNSLWFYRARQDGSYSFNLTDAATAQARVSFPPLTTDGSGDGKWHHYVIVVERSATRQVVQGYRDGRLIDERPIPPELRPLQNNGDLIFGNGHHHNSPWSGALDELAFYEQALTPQQIKRRYAEHRLPMASVPRQRTAQEKTAFFENEIRPLLIAKCVDCHNGEPSSESDLVVLSRSGLIAGADFGPAIYPGRAVDSTLIQAIKWTHKTLRMPPSAEDRLTKEEIRSLEEWINDGAVFPQSTATVPGNSPRPSHSVPDEALRTDHWAFQPRVAPEPPAVANARWSRTPIDRFLEAARQQAGGTATQPAPRQQWLRRVTFDLTGLPPSPAEVNTFLVDPRPDAVVFAEAVDRLLASPHYGERWGRHWMDVARYADTQGDVGDYPIPDAWRYRNWIIEALNRDLPFDAFLRAQIAGDVVAWRDLQAGTIDEPAARELTIATGFLALSQRYGNSKREHLHLTLENTLDTLGRGVLGLTLRCSRCHDHPFDPIFQSDYYGLYGILDSTTLPWMGMSVEKSPSGLVPTVPSPSLQQQATEHWQVIARYEYQINNHFRPWLKPTLEAFQRVNSQWKAAAPDSPQQQALGQQRAELLDRHGGKFRELMLHGLDWLKREKTSLARRPPLEMVFGVAEGKPHDAAIHRRGEPHRTGPVVPRRFLQVIDGTAPPKIARGSGRLELANWLTRPDHPLVPRVLVNRIWQRHFGRGLVTTPDNFGIRGESPSHPELLDWLAQRLVDDDWSLKQLHRRILLTETYRLASTPAASESDPHNVYLTRFPQRRLEGEAIRDAMLAVTGELDRTPAAAHPLPSWDQKRYGLNGPFHAEFETNRRSVYLLTQRLFDHSFLGLFNPPDRSATTAIRASTDVPGQSLYLMNSPFIKQRANAFAKRLLQERPTDRERIQHAYQLCYSRPPTDDEVADLLNYIQRYQAADQASDDRQRVWTSMARAMLTSNEFFFLD